MIRCILFLLLFNGHAQYFLAQNQSKIDQYLSHVYANHVMPGFSVIVVNELEVVFASSYGFANREGGIPFTIQTVNPIGSLTKSITALAILQLAEKGKLSLDAPVIEYLPDFTTANPEKSKKITVRMLLNNTSGLTGQTRNSYDMSDGSIEKMLEDLSNAYVLTEPGSVYAYSNIGFSIAGLLISKVSRQSYDAYVRENIFEPLKMFDSSVLPINSENKATGHFSGIHQAIPSRDNEMMGGEFIPAGRFAQSTVSNLSHYLRMYLNDGAYAGRKVISSGSLKKMWYPQIDFIGLSEEEGGDGNKFQYGLGWMISEIDGRKVVHHGGSTGTASSFTMIDPANGWAVSLLSNIDLTLINRRDYAFGLHIVNNVLHLAAGNAISDYGIPVAKDPTENPYQLPLELMDNYTGHYKFKQGGDQFVYYDDPDVIISQEGPELKGTVIRQGQVINEFVLDFVNPSLAVSRNMGSPSFLRIQFDRKGEAVRLFCFGMELRKERSDDFNTLIGIDIGRLALKIPQNWSYLIYDEVIQLTHPDYHNAQVKVYRNGDGPYYDSIGGEYMTRYNRILWHKRSQVLNDGGKHLLATSFDTSVDGINYRVQLISRPTDHSFLMTNAMIPLLQTVRTIKKDERTFLSNSK